MLKRKNIDFSNCFFYNIVMKRDYSNKANENIKWLLCRKANEKNENNKPKYDIAINLIKLRTKAKMSQTELGNNIGVPQEYINRWEVAFTAPNLRYLKDIASYFSVSVDYLLSEFIENR